MSKIDGTRAVSMLGTVGALVALCAVEAAADIKQPHAINPVVQDTVRKNAADIETVLNRALDPALPSPDRVDAVRQLSGIYFDYLLANAGDLVGDQNPEVAAAVVRSLGGQIAMLPDHQHGTVAHGAGAAADYDTYQRDVVQDSLAALRAALEHPAAEVRNEAAAILSSRGDAQALARIQGLIDEGKMDGKQGIGYLSLAPTDVASGFIEKYAASPDPEVQAAAVGQLAYNPDYTAQIRDLILSPDAESRLVTTALPGLAATDDQFLSYGLALAQNPNVDEATRTQAFESTITYTIRTEASEAAVRTLVPVLTDTADELSSPSAMESLGNLKSVYEIE